MNPDDHTELSDLDSHDLTRDDLLSRIRCLDLGEEDFSRLKSLQKSLLHLQDQVIDDLIGHLSSIDQTASASLSDSGGRNPLRSSLDSYFRNLISGRYDLEYFRARLMDAHFHESIGLSPQSVLGVYFRYLLRIIPEIPRLQPGHSSESISVISSLIKIFYFDVSLILDSLFERSNQHLQTIHEYEEKLLENIPDGLLVLSPNATILSASQCLYRKFGFQKTDLVGKLFSSVFQANGFMEEFTTFLMKGGVRHGFHVPFGRVDTEALFPVRVTFIEIQLSQKQSRFFVLLEDLSEETALRIQALGSERRFINLAETAISSIFILDQSAKIVYFNVASELMFGLSRDRALGERSERFLPDMNPYLSASAVRKSRIQETKGRRADGTEFPIEVSLSHFDDETGSFKTLVIRDLTERKRFETQVLKLANFDPLTGLPNRTYIVGKLEKIMNDSLSNHGTGAILFLDMDRFQLINESMGYEFGDRLLVEISQRLSACVRRQDLVARLGGDRFVLLLEGVEDKSEALKIGEKILDELARPFEIDRSPVFMSASMGISFWPEDGTTSDLLLRRADTAMYQAKEIGNTCEIYRPDVAQHLDKKFEIERDLRGALERHEFTLCYQPQIDLATQKVVGAEALIRWNHPEKGLILPEEFIPVAESTGLIVAIGTWVIRAACEQIHAWKRQGFEGPSLTVNVSGRQIERGSLAEIFRTALHETRTDGQCLEVEITESVLMKQTLTLRALKDLSGLGIRTAIDDFGTGYSSLSYLTQLPVYKLKIDRSFVTALPTDPNIRAVTTAIITMATALGLRSIAEGVETKEQVEVLQSLGCHEIQGYYYSPPLSPDDFILWNNSIL